MGIAWHSHRGTAMGVIYKYFEDQRDTHSPKIALNPPHWHSVNDVLGRFKKNFALRGSLRGKRGKVGEEKILSPTPRFRR